MLFKKQSLKKTLHFSLYTLNGTTVLLTITKLITTMVSIVLFIHINLTTLSKIPYLNEQNDTQTDNLLNFFIII